MDNQSQPSLAQEQLMQIRDEALLLAARSLGLPAVKQGELITTGIERLSIRPTSVGTLNLDNGTLAGCAVTIDVAVQDAIGNKGCISQAVAEFAPGKEVTVQELLTNLAQKWSAGVLPPLCRLLGAEYGEFAGRLRLKSYTAGDTQVTLWEGFAGKVQFWGDESLRQIVDDGTPYGLVQEALLNHQSEKCLHWVDVYGVRYDNGTAKFTIEIDNLLDPQACAEATDKFDWTSISRACSFRQFFIVRPCGSEPLEETDERMMKAIRDQQIDTNLRKQKPRFRFPFGNRQV